MLVLVVLITIVVFQIGLSILENIVECMDRSHAILLVVSSAFVRSKWCQFEMHLAQYRLIETLRDQLVLVSGNTLHIVVGNKIAIE